MPTCKVRAPTLSSSKGELGITSFLTGSEGHFWKSRVQGDVEFQDFQVHNP